MPEYVYALFDFVPENPDELHFKAGERIEVVERDDVYGDGWWQVSPSSIGCAFPSDVEALSSPDFVFFGGRKCTGVRRIANAQEGFLRPVSPLPALASIRARKKCTTLPSYLVPLYCLARLRLGWYWMLTFFS